VIVIAFPAVLTVALPATTFGAVGNALGAGGGLPAASPTELSNAAAIAHSDRRTPSPGLRRPQAVSETGVSDWSRELQTN
jgi:hypothetical protein